MSPKDLIINWVESFNRNNAQEISEFYHDDAINHQVANEPVEGKQAIFKMFESEFMNAKMTCEIENLFQDGEWAILEWKDPNGFRGCGFFQVIDNKIFFQRGYWDKLSFLKTHNLPIPY